MKRKSKIENNKLKKNIDGIIDKFEIADMLIENNAEIEEILSKNGVERNDVINSYIDNNEYFTLECFEYDMYIYSKLNLEGKNIKCKRGVPYIKFKTDFEAENIFEIDYYAIMDEFIEYLNSQLEGHQNVDISNIIMVIQAITTHDESLNNNELDSASGEMNDEMDNKDMSSGKMKRGVIEIKSGIKWYN